MADTTDLPDDVNPDELAEALQLLRQRRAKAPSEETVFVRGEGGAVFEMAPSRMSKEMKRQMQLGRLRRVNPDGTAYRTRNATSPAPADGGGAGGSALTEGRVPRPAKAAPKRAWVTYAVAALGLEVEAAEGMTRAELQDLPEDFADHQYQDEDLDPDLDEDEESATSPAASGDGRPADSAPKRDWIDHIVRRGMLSREDAANYTRADLIAMVS